MVAILGGYNHISPEPLESGYIQTLEELPCLVEAYVASPYKINSLR